MTETLASMSSLKKTAEHLGSGKHAVERRDGDDSRNGARTKAVLTDNVGRLDEIHLLGAIEPAVKGKERKAGFGCGERRVTARLFAQALTGRSAELPLLHMQGGRIVDWRAEPPCYGGMLHASGPIAVANFTLAAGALDDPQRVGQLWALIAAFGDLERSVYACAIRRNNLLYRDGQLASVAGTTGVRFYLSVLGSRWPGCRVAGRWRLSRFGAPYLSYVPLVVDEGRAAGSGVLIEYRASDAQRAQLGPARLLSSARSLIGRPR